MSVRMSVRTTRSLGAVRVMVMVIVTVMVMDARGVGRREVGSHHVKCGPALVLTTGISNGLRRSVRVHALEDHESTPPPEAVERHGQWSRIQLVEADVLEHVEAVDSDPAKSILIGRFTHTGDREFGTATAAPVTQRSVHGDGTAVEPAPSRFGHMCNGHHPTVSITCAPPSPERRHATAGNRSRVRFA